MSDRPITSNSATKRPSAASLLLKFHAENRDLFFEPPSVFYYWCDSFQKWSPTFSTVASFCYNTWFASFFFFLSRFASRWLKRHQVTVSITCTIKVVSDLGSFIFDNWNCLNYPRSQIRESCFWISFVHLTVTNASSFCHLPIHALILKSVP